MNSEAPFNQLRFWLRLDDVSVLDVNKLTAQPEMELGPFIDDVPIKLSIYKGFSMAMLNNQR